MRKAIKLPLLCGLFIAAFMVGSLNNVVLASQQVKYKLSPEDYSSWKKLIKNDVEQSGADVTKMKSVSLRQMNHACSSEQPYSDPIEKDRVMLKDDYFRIQLKAEDTSTCYDSSEIYLGQSYYLDQPSLLAADARGDKRVFKPGKELSFKTRFSDAYKTGEAKGNVGVVGQGWEFAEYPLPDGSSITVPNYVIVGVSYVYDLEAQGFVLPTGVYTIVIDFSTGFFDIYPITEQIGDISTWHTYSVTWEEGNTFNFSVDGVNVRTVEATQMRVGGAPTHVGAWLDNNDFAYGFSIQGTGYQFTRDQYMDIKYIKVESL